MDSNSAASTRGRCRVCLDSDVDVVALSLTVCVFAEEITFSKILTTCCAIEISDSDLKPQIICIHCAKLAEQSFLFRKTCHNTNLILQEELDGVIIKVESSELIIRDDKEEELGRDNIKAESDEIIIKEEDDHTNGVRAVIKDELPDHVSISNTDGLTQLQPKQNTSNTEEDWISLGNHLGTYYRRVCGVSGQLFTSTDKHTQTHEIPRTEKTVILLKREKSKFHKCSYCKMSYKYPAELRYHLMTHTAMKRHLCSYCGNNFSLCHRSKCQRTHSQHRRKHINKKTNNKATDYLKIRLRFNCSACKKSFRRQKYFMNHKCINTNKKPHKCAHCSKEFAFASKLREHIRTHTGEKPFECSYCNKRFIKKGILNVHERTHTGNKPYECSHCSKSFIQQCYLNAHLRTHTGEKPYECIHCRMRFTDQSTLTKHTRSHTGEKPYQCSHCSKCFSRKSSVTVHERIHTGETPYECSHCSKRFKQHQHLKKHERTHTGEKPYN